MKISFRIDCPHCHWGYPWSDRYVNTGWLILRCGHCNDTFCLKINIPVVQVETEKILPKGEPCQNLVEITP